jgi:hypothetical protein
MFLDRWRNGVMWASESVGHSRRRQWRRSKPVHYKPKLERLEERTLLSTKIWTGAVDSDWSNDGNWNGGAPGLLDSARFDNTAIGTTATVDASFLGVINALTIDSTWNGTITVDRSLIITGGLSLGDGTFGGNGPVTIGGLSSWSGGNLVVGSSLINNGTLTLSNTDLVYLTGGGILTNNESIIQGGTADLKFLGGTKLDNAGSYEIRTDTNISFGPGDMGEFNNFGTFGKTAGDRTSSIMIDFNNMDGTIYVTSGTFAIKSSSALLAGGTFTVGLDAVFDLTGGAAVKYTGSFSGSGAGKAMLGSGILHVVNYMGSGGATFDFGGGLFQWLGGILTIDSNAALLNSGTLNLASSSTMPLNGGGPLTNYGTIHQSGKGDLEIDAGNPLTNTVFGLYEFDADSGVFAKFTPATFVNAGTITKDAGTGVSTIALDFSNRKAINVNTGTIKIESGSGINSAGVFGVAAGAVLDLAGDTSVNYTGMYTGSGAGTVELAGGILNIVTTADSAGATFNFPPGLFQWKGGIITLASGATLTNVDTVTLSNADKVVLNGAGSLINQGTIVQSGMGGLLIQISLSNMTGGIYDFRADSGIAQAFGGIFTNAGLIKKSGGSGTTDFASGFAGRATIAVESGKIKFEPSLASTINGGIFTIAEGAALDLPGGTAINYTGMFTGSGAGTVELDGGILNIGTTMASAGATFNFSPGLLQWKSGIITVASAATLTIAGTFTLSNADQVVLNGTGSVLNDGTVIQSGNGGLLNQNPFTNNADGVYDLRADSGIAEAFGGTFTNAGILKKSAGSGTSAINGFFSNLGTVEALSGTLALSSVMQQISGNTLTGGTWEVFDPATLILNGGVNLTTNDGNIVLDGPHAVFANISRLTTNGGSLSIQDGNNFTTVGDFNNVGSVNVAGTLVVNGNFANSGSVSLLVGSSLMVSGGYTQTNGSTTLSAATLSASGLVDLQGGTLSGSGTIAASLQNAGLIEVGGSGAAGLLTITGDYTQTASGVLHIEIGGYNAGTDFDLLAIGGMATLDGALNVSFINGFGSISGDTFQVVTFAAQSGTFANTVLDASLNNLPTYDATDVTVQAI